MRKEALYFKAILQQGLEDNTKLRIFTKRF